MKSEGRGLLSVPDDGGEAEHLLGDSTNTGIGVTEGRTPETGNTTAREIANSCNGVAKLGNHVFIGQRRHVADDNMLTSNSTKIIYTTYGCVQVCTAMSSLRVSNANLNPGTSATMFTPIMKWVTFCLVCSKNWYSLGENCCMKEMT
jgi:hypothetical protein